MWLLRRAFRLVVAFVLAVLVAGAVMVDRFGRQEPAVTAPVIVVLGARVLEGGVPSSALRARVEKAVELYRSGAAPLLLFSGGLGDHAPSEAQVAQELAIRLGVPESACLREEQSHSTYENAVFTAKLLRERGLQQAIVVSDPYHLYRARQNFWAQGIDVTPIPAKYTERNLNAKDRAWWTVREVLALLRRPSLFFARRPEVTRGSLAADRERDGG